jgi:site-specific recombinase XerD
MIDFAKGSLFAHIRNYIKFYLPKQRQVSQHTIRSYRNALEQLTDFIKDTKHIPLADVTFDMLTSEMILAYLDYSETGRGCSVSTRNNRLAAIRAFVKHAASIDISVVVFAEELKKVLVKKPDEIEVVGYMSMAAITAIIQQPDITKLNGLRDRFFLILLYDTGARIDEMIHINLCDLHISKQSKITLHGKGNKARTIPIMDKTAQHLRKHLSVFHNGNISSGDPLFYVETHGQRNPLSASCIRKFLVNYGESARRVCAEVPESIHAHLWRHSRAMHLYQGGMDLTLVSQWLGHKNPETTLVYAHADTEQKRKAIAAATPTDSPLGKRLNPARFTVSDDDTIKRLTGMR